MAYYRFNRSQTVKAIQQTFVALCQFIQSYTHSLSLARIHRMSGLFRGSRIREMVPLTWENDGFHA